ncbi:uv-damage endonuclease protein [Apiospora marii]|uniref:uv-damage endonuclease protein n=1 Tax=Apiospora marii TaxID=335849 RepID=UPI00312CE837
MVSKRKKSEMALLQQDVLPNQHFDAEPRPDFAPRRSARAAKNAAANEAEPFKAETEQDGSRESRSKNNGQIRRRRGDVEEAMHDLQDMEAQLRGVVKRQKLAIKSSSVMSEPDNFGKDVFTPKSSKSGRDTLKSADHWDEHQTGPARKPAAKAKTPKASKTSKASSVKDEVVDKEEASGMTREDPEEPVEPEAEDINDIKLEGARPPPVNSDYLPLPWKGRLGYACLNTYLRQTIPPVFSSRTCRIASIIEHRHPLADPSQPEHATKNRPDKDQPADVARGQKFVEELGVANARDIVKMLRWNDKYGIKFMRLSSEMFPFASHEEHGYKLAPFASEVLAEAGRVAGELGHRLTTHPGQFTQLGSPRNEVVRNAVRDLEYHNELLSLLRLPEQQNKDAVMILHMGGMFGDKEATLDRFRANYAKLSPEIKARLVLENDDVCYSVHELLPICEELNIPMVLDFHHHNIIFDKEQLREGTKDIMDLFPRIKATWDRKGITQKMHYSEPCSEAITGRQRRKHRPRVLTLPPCADDMDLMIEAKDKEQAVFELMRTYRLPGWDSFNDLVPYERDDDNRPVPKAKTPKKKRKSKKAAEEEEDEDVDMLDGEEEPTRRVIPEEEVGMGGPENRVFWPMGMEEWLRPKKREVKKKGQTPQKKDAEEDED